MNNYCINLAFIFFLTYTYNCLKVIPERGAITYLNETYVTNASFNVRRYKRRGEYVVNLEFISHVWAGNNISVEVILYQYLHNEYKRSFVEFHYKCCDLVHKDPYIGYVIRQAGVTKCPVGPNKFSLKNMTFNMDFPSVWPFEKGKGVLTVTDNTNGVMVASGELVVTFKQNLAKL